MEYMNKIKESGNSDYTIICFDLNDLKITNDTYGHARGDILIKSAAEVIKDTFEPHGVVARIGGDEFISILNTTLPEEVSCGYPAKESGNFQSEYVHRLRVRLLQPAGTQHRHHLPDCG